METRIFAIPISYSNPQFAPSVFLFDFPLFSRGSRESLRFSRRKCLHVAHKSISVRASCASGSANYGGWDEFRIFGDSECDGESDQFRNFLVSVKVEDRKHIFVFLLGLVCALAISRVRVSSTVMFPASILVFAIGFSFGFIRAGKFSEVSENGGKKRVKEEIYTVYTDKSSNLVDFFDGFDVKVNNLKNDIQKAIDNNEITVSDLESYVNEIESISSSASKARNIAKASIDNAGNSNVLLVENQKPSRRKKELGEVGFELLQSVGSFFGENSVGSKPNKVKDNIKRQTVERLVNDQNRVNVSTSAVEESDFNLVDGNKGNGKLGVSQDSSAFVENGGRRIKIDSKMGKMNEGEIGGSGKRFIESEEYSYRNNSLRFTNNQTFSLKMGHDNRTEMWESHDKFNSEEFRVRMKRLGTEASFVQQQMLKKSNGAFRTSLDSEMNDDETYRFQTREEILNHEYDSHMANQLSSNESEVDSFSSPKVSDDVVFDRYFTEANELLKQAKEYIRSRRDKERAEIILYRSAKLLSRAIAMKPVSLLAVGQLGNTYLLHGELKLKMSRELRALLLGGGPFPIEKRNGVLKGLGDQITGKDEIASVLVNVCEECEELLVEAGRKYRLALSIDGNDVRALYNWGLALSFRAQLIADIGPEAAFEADEVFLAAIDKFDAMMSKGNVYAPDALFRWGVALQQRSRLRPRNSKEKVKLLQQAKRLYEDALHMDSDNLQVREALSTCVSELNFRHF
ncbi:hypothetical protein F2P56_006282 [Juglans regia]|uniref:Uncharacterized protein n=2 Tax=Juglans regia TaxID=51240 RepID=A0A834D3A7_JUGRE|nr:uncharacterized protein LOC108990630 [Juglans regia]KAF5474378.1 hypothetical protein F2P56_006282 [Juglans regia]